FVAVRPSGGLCGFLEGSIRPFAGGCETLPVGDVGGGVVDAAVRRQGIGGGLVTAARRWASAPGGREMASDAHPANGGSLEARQALGFEESGRAVHLRKRLAGANGTAGERTAAAGQRTLVVLDGTFAVCKLGVGSSIPPWATAGDFFSVTRTADELSAVCRQ